MKTSFCIMLFLAMAINSYSQSKEDCEQIASTPKIHKAFPLNYKILLPRLEFIKWDDDFDKFYSYLTPALRKTQATMSYNSGGVHTMLNPNSIIPHAQLDTAITIKSKEQLAGAWRMITFRSIRFNDSVDIKEKNYYRFADTLLTDRSNDEAIAFFDDNKFQLFAKEAGKREFKKVASAKYTLENKRYLMLYKLSKAGSGVSQVGIDEDGYLILNYPRVIEQQKKGEYISYYAVIDQYIYVKVK
jgi:restriction endonuclease S subunit